MDRQLSLARQITPFTVRKWCVLVQVIKRRKPKRKDNGPLYRNYVLTDTEGTKVPMIIYDGNVAYFDNKLQPFKRYYVSNAYVKETPPNYRVHDFPYTWTLQRKNLVEPVDEQVPPPLPCTFTFTRFKDFYLYADQERPICIKALVVRVLPVQESNAASSYRDCVVINEEMIPIILRVWDDVQFDTDVNVYAKYKLPTLIVAYGLKATTQHGLSLRTKTNAYIMEDPPLNESVALKDWFTAHATQIIKMVEDRTYRDTTILFHPPRPSEILPLQFALTTIDQAKTVWTEGKLTYLPGQQKLWFEACENCLTELDVDTD